MKMLSVDHVTTRAIRAVLPEPFKGMTYTKLADGMEVRITKISYSVYPAKDKETKEILTRKDGTQLMKTTAYIGFDDGTYSTVANEYAIGQLISVTGDFAEDTGGVYSFDIEPCHVRVTTKDIQYGNKTFPSWVFIPYED